MDFPNNPMDSQRPIYFFASHSATEKLIFTISADDIFKSERERWTLHGYGTTLDKDCYNYSRAVSLTVTYNFNAKRSKYKGTGAGNAEKSRL